MAWRLLILLTTLAVALAGAEKLELTLQEGTPCPYRHNYPESTCLRTCPRIEQHFIKQTMARDDVTECNVAQRLICCPNQPPQDPEEQRVQLLPPVAAEPEHDARKYPHLAALRFLRAGPLDSYVYRCTAVLVRPNFVLTSNLCGVKESEMEKSPNRARLGLAEPYPAPLEITGHYNYKKNNDLSLLRLTRSYANESVARICGEQDLASARRLVAVGFSQLQDENCDWFEMEVSLREFSSCAVQLNNSIRGIDGPQTHFCVEPVNPPRPVPGGCIQCLRGSASILHAVLPDGGLCVAAVATPTASNCHSSGPRLYYTSLVSREVFDFIQGAQ